MKRTIRKHLSLLLAVLMLITGAGVNVIAASNECVHLTDKSNPAYCKVVSPTCEEEGYTIYYCILCSTENNMVEVSRGEKYQAFGHTFGDEAFELIDENDESKGYQKYKLCERKFNDGTVCGAKSVESVEGNPVVYYRVDFVNNRVPATYKTDANGVRLIDTFEKEGTVVASYFVKSGDSVTDGGKKLNLGKTEAFGAHVQVGWTTNSNLEIKAKNTYDESVFASFEKIEANTKFYPVFAGEDVYYDVIFHSDKGQITNPQSVKHGETPVFRVNADPMGKPYDNPTRDADIANYYDFNGWSKVYGKTEGIFDIESTPIYERTNYYPTFKAIPKNYTVEFYATDSLTGQAPLLTVDGVHFYDNLLKNTTVAKLNNNSDLFKKTSDETYHYLWTGKWKVIVGDAFGSTVDLRDFKVKTGDIYNVIDTNQNPVLLPGERQEQKKIIRLVPDYEKRLRLYKVEIEMAIPHNEDSDYYRGGADVHVVANNNQLVASGVTDANGKFYCELNYQVPFTVTVATADEKYLGTARIVTLDSAGTKCYVSMEKNPDYETHCTCIHHNSLLQPIFVRILNILYTFFNVKYVCCYDMYSTIGPLLAYTAD